MDNGQKRVTSSHILVSWVDGVINQGRKSIFMHINSNFKALLPCGYTPTVGVNPEENYRGRAPTAVQFCLSPCSGTKLKQPTVPLDP